MEHHEFVHGYRTGTMSAHVDRSKAMHVCDRRELMPGRYRAAHYFWKYTSVLLVIGGLASLFWVRWWVGVSAVMLGFVTMPAVQRSAARFVLEYALEDPAFFRRMVNAGVLRITDAVKTGGTS